MENVEIKRWCASVFNVQLQNLNQSDAKDLGHHVGTFRPCRSILDFLHLYLYSVLLMLGIFPENTRHYPQCWFDVGPPSTTLVQH